jgi:ribonuclease HI
MQDAISKQRIIGAGIFTPTTDAAYSDTVTINPGGSGPTLTINRAELAAVLVAVQKGHTEIAIDSASSLFQIKKQLLNPLAVLHHLHKDLQGHCKFIQSSPSTVTFYKVKSHSGIIGNEGADHISHKAAVNQISDISLPPPTDPFYNQFWLSVPNKVGSHAEDLRVLTNLQDKLKHHMHANHYRGEANTDTLLYKFWQKLHDTPKRAAQPDSQQPNAKPLAQFHILVHAKFDF